MNKMVWILSFLLWCTHLSAQANRVFVLPLQSKSGESPDQKKVTSALHSMIREYIGQKPYYELMDTREFREALRKSQVNPRDFYDLPRRDECLKKISSYVDYLFIGEITFYENQTNIAIGAKFYRTLDGEIFKSAAIPGNRRALENLVGMLASKIIPSSEEIVEEIKKSYAKAHEQKNYTRCVDIASWGIKMEPKSWVYYYYRGIAHEENKAYVEAEEDYEDASKLHRGHSPKIAEALKRIKPLVMGVQKERKKLLRKIDEEMKRIDLEYRSKIEVFPELFQEIAKIGGKMDKTEHFRQQALELNNLYHLLKNNILVSKREGASKKANEDLTFLLGKIGQIFSEIEAISNFLANGFEKAGREYFKKGVQAYQEDRLEECILLLNKAALLLPKDPEIHYWSGNAFEKMGNPKEAFFRYSRAIELKPDHSRSYYQRGVLYHRMKEQEKAIENLLSAIKHNPDMGEAHLALGDIYEEQKEYDKAIASYGETIQRNPKNANAFFKRGKLLDRTYDYLKACEDYKRVIDLAPHLKVEVYPLLSKVNGYLIKDAHVFANRGKAFMDTGEIELAIADFNKALQYNPDYYRVYFYRGFCHHMLGKGNLALKDYDEAIGLRRIEPDFYYARAITYQKLGKFTESIQDLQKTMELNPSFHAAHHRMGLLYEEKKDYKNAVKSYERAIDVYPGKSFYYYELSRVYLSMGNLDMSNANRMKARDLEKQNR